MRRATMPVLLMCGLATGGLACADKQYAPVAPHASAAMVRLRTTFAAQSAPTARVVDVQIGYDRTSGERVKLAEQETPVATGTQQIAISVDVSVCLTDRNRAGSSTVCPLRIMIALRDANAIALDSIELGPVDAGPGAAPQLPQVDLAVQRFAVREWLADTALRLGSSDTPSGGFLVFTGLVTGPGAPSLYAVGGTVTAKTIAIYENSRWRAVPVGLSSVVVFDLAMVSPTEGWIATGNGLYRFDGTNATPIAGITDSLRSVAAIGLGASRIVIAVGVNGAVWRGDGTTWTRDQIGAVETLAEVCVSAVDEAFIGSPLGTIWRWNGSQWSITSSSFTGATTQLQCPVKGKAFALAPAPIQWTGNAWVAMGNIGTAPVNSMSAVSPTEVYAWATDPSTLVQVWYQYNGSTWQLIRAGTFGQGSRGSWADPRGGRAFSLTAFGRLQSYDLSTTQITILSYTPDVRDLIMTSPTSGFAVGWNLFLARWDGVRWTIDAPPANTPSVRILEGVWSDGPSNAWAVGNATTILRWDGTRWNVVSDAQHPIATPGDSYNAVWGGGSTVLIAGFANIVRCTSATSCANEVVPGSGSLLGIWGTSLNNVFAVGVGGRIVRYNGTSWSQMTSPTTHALSRVWGSSATNVWAVGDSVLVHFDGTAWADVPMTGDLAAVRASTSQTTGLVQLGLWGTAANDVYLGGDGKIARFDGTSWRLMPTTTQGRVVAISGVPGFGAMALLNGSVTGPSVLRGAGPTGGLASPIVTPAIWP